MTKGAPKGKTLWEPAPSLSSPGLASWGRRGGRVLCRTPSGEQTSFPGGSQPCLSVPVVG